MRILLWRSLVSHSDLRFVCVRVCVCASATLSLGFGFWVLEGKRFSFSLSFFIHNSLTVTEGNVMRLLGLGAG